MCLASVFKCIEPNDDMVVGYKIFKMKHGHPYGLFRSGRYDVGKHHQSDNGILYSGTYGEPYERGFHFYTTIDDALSCADFEEDKVYEVHLWDVRAYGIQSGVTAGTAKNMRVIKQVGGKP